MVNIDYAKRGHNGQTPLDQTQTSLASGAVSRRTGEAVQQPAVRPALDIPSERAARVFLRRLEGRYFVREAILFGSRARGVHGADADADIAVVLNGARGDRMAAALDMAGIAFDVLLETGILVEALPLWKEEIERPDLFSNPALIESIRRDGVRL